MSTQPDKPQPSRTVGHDGAVFRCPMCRAVLPTTNLDSFPFCSERCRLHDLSNWLDGNYTVSRPIDPSEPIEDLPRARPQQSPPPSDDPA